MPEVFCILFVVFMFLPDKEHTKAIQPSLGRASAPTCIKLFWLFSEASSRAQINHTVTVRV